MNIFKKMEFFLEYIFKYYSAKIRSKKDPDKDYDDIID